MTRSFGVASPKQAFNRRGRGESRRDRGKVMSDAYAIMSDMASQRITVRVPTALGARLKNRSRLIGESPSEIVRAALENYLDNGGGGRSAYDVAKAAGIIGCIKRAPKDLSTNPRHFEGFGRNK